MATLGIDRFVVVRRPYGFVVSDQITGIWLRRLHKTSAGAHRKADRLNRETRAARAGAAPLALPESTEKPS